MTDQSSEQGTIRYVRCPSCVTPNLASVGTCPPPAKIAPPVAPRPKVPAAAPVPIPKSQSAVPGVAIPMDVASFSEVRPDGSFGKTVNVEKELVIGRGECEVRYPDDVLLSPRHASVTFRDGKLRLKDLGSQNGTFIKQRHDTELRPGDVFLLGRELFRFTTQSLEESQSQASPQGTMVMKGAPKLQRGPITAKLEHIQLTGEAIEEFSLGKPETTLSRSNGDLVFKNDPYMSGTHARITAHPGPFTLQVLKRTNAASLRIVGAVELRDGDEFFLGEQRFRVALKTS